MDRNNSDFRDSMLDAFECNLFQDPKSSNAIQMQNIVPLVREFWWFFFKSPFSKKNPNIKTEKAFNNASVHFFHLCSVNFAFKVNVFKGAKMYKF